MNKIEQFIKDWMLLLAIFFGVSSCLLFRYWGPLQPYEAGYESIAASLQPIFIMIMLFLQFNSVSPHDLRIKKWHLWLLLIQASLFGVFAFLCVKFPAGTARILLECCMVCFICPTAAAAGVITQKLGGKMSDIMTYVVLINTLASILIPLIVPFLRPASDGGFLHDFLAIIKRVFSLLLLPCITAWIIRYCFRRLQRWLMRYANWAFYFWGCSLLLSMVLATRSFINSHVGVLSAFLIAAVSLSCCLLQFKTGRQVARKYGKAEAITAGQALGQKNTGFLIWLAFSFLTPVSSVAGGFYAVWHNIVNSWELYRKRVSGS